MPTTNRVYCWKDGERLFVDLNGATVEAKSLTFDQQIVTLQFQARLTLVNNADACRSKVVTTAPARPVMQGDPLLDECLW